MTRLTAAALLATLALVATLVGPCLCLPEATATAEHACCAPPAGFRPAEGGCCPEVGEARGAASTLPSPPCAVTGLVRVAAVAPPPAAPPSAAAPARPAPDTSPPLAVRRL